MYCIKICYPKKEGSTFNFKHYFDVHAPLGQSLLIKHCGVTPVKVLVDDFSNSDEGDNNTGYHCICSIYFRNMEEAHAMFGMFDIDEARHLLTEDFPNYTDVKPQIIMSQVTELDPATGRPLNT